MNVSFINFLLLAGLIIAPLLLLILFIKQRKEIKQIKSDIQDLREHISVK